MNVKELLMNEELVDNIVEDIEDIPEDSEVSYEVWALGYTDDEDCTDAEYLLGEFDDPDEAVEFAENLTMFNISCAADEETGCEGIPEEVAFFSIEVEAVVEDPDDEGTMNLGTVYSRELWIDGEHCSEDKVPNDDPIVALNSGDYALTPDGELKVSCKLLKDFNKNDYIYVDFVEEPNAAIIIYKIVSKVVYEDGDYYHCELMI